MLRHSLLAESRSWSVLTNKESVTVAETFRDETFPQTLERLTFYHFHSSHMYIVDM